MDYNLLFRWFVGLGVEDTFWVRNRRHENCNRLRTTDMPYRTMATILAHRDVAPLLSDDHFSVDAGGDDLEEFRRTTASPMQTTFAERKGGRSFCGMGAKAIPWHRLNAA